MRCLLLPLELRFRLPDNRPSSDAAPAVATIACFRHTEGSPAVGLVAFFFCGGLYRSAVGLTEC
jgi:hypothetical protein